VLQSFTIHLKLSGSSHLCTADVGVHSHRDEADGLPFSKSAIHLLVMQWSIQFHGLEGTIVSLSCYHESIGLQCSMPSMLLQVHPRYLRSFFRGVQSNSEVTIPSPTRDRPPGAKPTHQQKCFCRRLTLFFFLHRTLHRHRRPSPTSPTNNTDNHRQHIRS
jgi:hypothetical protein